MQARLNDRIIARKLREQGLSFSEISEKIPNLSKGTLNGWLKDIELTSEQKVRLLNKMRDKGNVGRLRGAFINHHKRIESIKQIMVVAKEEVEERMGNTLFVTGVMLYWAEGDKTQERVGFTNSDPEMIKFMMRWLREVCKVPELKFRIALSIMTLHNRKISEEFWSKLTGVP